MDRWTELKHRLIAILDGSSGLGDEYDVGVASALRIMREIEASDRSERRAIEICELDRSQL